MVLTLIQKTAEFIPISRSELFSTTDLVANCGGILGLFMGFSLFSLAEIVYYCTLRPMALYFLKRRQLTSNSTQPVVVLPAHNMLQLDN